MCDVAQNLINQGISQGINKGISQGIEKKGKDDIKKLADYFRKTDPKLTKKAATEMAKQILK